MGFGAMVGKVVRQVIVIFSLCLLTEACSSGDTVGRDAQFDTASGGALVVMGLSSTNRHYEVEVTWWPVDPVSKQFTGKKDGSVLLQRDSYETYMSVGLTDMRYLIFRVPSGQYALFSTVVRAHNLWETRYRPEAPAFAVADGEILYIGDFTFEVPEVSLFGKEKELNGIVFRQAGKDEQAAQSAVDEYPNVRGTIVYRPLESIRLN